MINVLGDKVGVLPIEMDLQERLGAEAVCIFSVQGDQGEDLHIAIQFGRAIGREELTEAVRAIAPTRVAEAIVHIVKEFPRNHMGKIERAELMRRLLPGPASQRD